ncbi:hypothetical protein Q9Q99_18545 [Curtobacterium flaccumfaciens]|nr:hypothetical protein Q9Q99_18545 [Curtobacterium flaccumfaciens]
MPSQTTVTAPPGRPAAPSTSATRRRVALASFIGDDRRVLRLLPLRDGLGAGVRTDVLPVRHTRGRG